MTPFPQHKLYWAAFSLLEMLLTISLIAILAILGFSSVRFVLEKSAQTKCLQNLRQLGMACLSYTADNGGFLPRGDIPRKPEEGGGDYLHWPYVISPWLGVDFDTVSKAANYAAFRRSPFCCPAEKEHGAYNYAMNRQLNERLYGNAAYIRLAQVVSPSRWVLISDGYSDRTIFTDTRDKMLNMTRMTRRHDGVPNFLYADGHVAPYHGEIYGIADSEGKNNPAIRTLWEYQYQP